MGVDLKALASHFRVLRGELLATASLRFERDPALFAQLAADAVPCLVSPLPAGMKVGHTEDEGLRWGETDRHGMPLTFTTPAKVAQLAVPEASGPWNRAILAFLLALPPDTTVVLWWY